MSGILRNMKLTAAALLLPFFANAAGNELAQCRKIFRDYVEITFFPMPCFAGAIPGGLEPQKFAELEKQKNLCGNLINTRYPEHIPEIRESLSVFAENHAKRFEHAAKHPNKFHTLCKRQIGKSVRLLQTY